MKKKSVLAAVEKSIKFAWKTDKLTFILILLMSLAQGSTVFMQLVGISAIVDEIIKYKEHPGDMGGLMEASFFLALAFLVTSILTNLITHQKLRFKMHQGCALDLYKIDKQGSLDIATLESSSYQTLLRSVKEWGNRSVIHLQDFTFFCAVNLSSIITSTVILWTLNRWLILFPLIAAAPIYFFYKKYSMEVFRIRHSSIDDHRIISNRISHFEELPKATDVTLLRLKDWLKTEIEDLKHLYNKKIISAEKTKTISASVLILWYLGFLFATIALVTSETLAGTIAVGGLILAFNTYTKYYQIISSIIEQASATEEAARYALQWFELVELSPIIKSKEGAIRLPADQSPSIEFVNVSFQYPGEQYKTGKVLKNLSFCIKPGEKIAIVGANGSGKTTLIKLLCRIYDPTEGSILINGIDLRDISLEDWHQLLSVLFQDFPIYNLSVRQSINIGNLSIRDDPFKIREAAEYSGVDEFINDYNQTIWKGFKNGIDLSKGQHQRIAIARMFYRNAAITMLDEPTASVDAATELRVLRSLEKALIDKTLILITHRASTCKKADNILMLEHGEIIEQGSHKKLMECDGKYASLFKMQANSYLQSGQYELINENEK